jgi:hypothetical protein
MIWIFVPTSPWSHTMLRTALLISIISITFTTTCLSETFQSIGTIDTYFSPRGGATEFLVKEINSASVVPIFYLVQGGCL